MKKTLILLIICMTISMASFGQETGKSDGRTIVYGTEYTKELSLPYDQTRDDFRAEEFMVEVFYGDMTEDSPKVYLSRESYRSSTGSAYDHSFELFYTLQQVLSKEEIEDFFIRYKDRNTLWDEHAPVFEQPKYKNLIFVDDIFRLSGRKQKRAELRSFSKPVFIKNGEYAYVEESNHLYY